MKPVRYRCPLCTVEFEDGWACHTGCPVSSGCGMIRCPRCSYEFVAESRIVNFVKGIFHRHQRREEEP
jgi:hypothetical protein